MKRIVALFLLFAMFVSTAYAEGLGAWLGGLSSLFSSDDEVTYGVGETVEIDGLTMKLINVMTSKGNSYYTPASGKEYVILEFEILNNTKEEIALSTLMNFTFWCDDTNYIIDLNALATAMLSGKYQLDRVVEAGQRATGVIGYEIPTNWEVLKVDFKKEIPFGDSVIFKVDMNAQ